MNRIARARENATIHLYTIAQPHFQYPRKIVSRWHLPIVMQWEPWLGEVTDKHSSKLYGQLIVPSVVVFLIPDPQKANVSAFKSSLAKLTNASWYADNKDLGSGLVVAVRLSKRVYRTTGFEDRTTQHHDLPWDHPTPEGWYDVTEWEARYPA